MFVSQGKIDIGVIRLLQRPRGRVFDRARGLTRCRQGPARPLCAAEGRVKGRVKAAPISPGRLVSSCRGCTAWLVGPPAPLLPGARGGRLGARVTGRVRFQPVQAAGSQGNRQTPRPCGSRRGGLDCKIRGRRAVLLQGPFCRGPPKKAGPLSGAAQRDGRAPDVARELGLVRHLARLKGLGELKQKCLEVLGEGLLDLV